MARPAPKNLGEALAALGRKVGLTGKGIAVKEKMQDKPPAECRVDPNPATPIPRKSAILQRNGNYAR
jgi:hypothetical protein